MAANDPYASTPNGTNFPARHAAAVSTSDTVDLSDVTRALYVGGAGNVVVITAGGETVTFTGVAAGSVLPVQVSRVKATGSTATAIVALW